MVRMQHTRHGIFYTDPSGKRGGKTEPTLDADAGTLSKVLLFTALGIAFLAFLASPACTRFLLLFMGA